MKFFNQCAKGLKRRTEIVSGRLFRKVHFDAKIADKNFVVVLSAIWCPQHPVLVGGIFEVCHSCFAVAFVFCVHCVRRDIVLSSLHVHQVATLAPDKHNLPIYLYTSNKRRVPTRLPMTLRHRR